MWKETGLIGRDNLLKKHILPRLRRKVGFVIMGQHGIGKTAVLEWAYNNAHGKKAMVSATSTVKEVLVEICVSWGIPVLNHDNEVVAKSSYRVTWMMDAILKEKGAWIFIDDIQKMTPAMIQKFKPIRDRCIIVASAVPPLKKDELKRMMWGLKNIDLPPLKRSDMKRIGMKAAVLIGSDTPIEEAAHASRGIPAHLFHALRGEVAPETAKTKDEEIDISPVLFIVLAGIMVLRYVGKGVDSMSLTLLGGFGMAAALIFRFFLFRGMKN